MIEFLKIKGCWRDVADAARTTVRMDAGTGEPSDKWKKNMILAEHSPIRKFVFNWKWKNIPYWVSVHLVRHKVGIDHFVSTQRSDRTGIKRDDLPQGAPVDHECEANLQAVLSISEKRLCKQASKETQDAWKEVIEEIKKVDPIIASCCVPQCIRCGGKCPEMKPCGWNKTEEAKSVLEKYWEGR